MYRRRTKRRQLVYVRRVILQSQCSEFSWLIRSISKHRDLLKSILLDGDENGTTPFYRNGWFENMDAVALAGMLAIKRPNNLDLEIGSGNSTKIARHAINCLGIPAKIISIDPQPRASIDTLCDRHIRQRPGILRPLNFH